MTKVPEMNKEVDECQSMNVDQSVEAELQTSSSDNDHLEEEEVMEEPPTLEQRLLAAWVATNYNGTAAQDYCIFAIRCKVSSFYSILWL